MPAKTLQCYCGSVFKAEAEYSERIGKMAVAGAVLCPGCGRKDNLATVGGQLATSLAQAAHNTKVAEEKATQERQAREYQEWFDKHYARMGFSPDWKPSYNVKRNGALVLNSFPRISGDDFCWLCNQIAKAVWSTNDSCIDNWRLARYRAGWYEETRARGCCGFYDEKVTNPKTGRSFWIGFNYGH